MGQSFKFLSCLSSEACTGYHCMLQGRGRRSVIRASQCTEHWVSASQNVSVAFKYLLLTKLPSERVKETSPLGSGNSRSLEDIIRQAGLGQQDIKAADNLNRKPGLIFYCKPTLLGLFIQSHAEAD